MNIKDELKKIIEEMENTMAIMDRCTLSHSLNSQWAMGAWNVLDIFKPRIEAILHRLIKEDVLGTPYP